MLNEKQLFSEKTEQKETEMNFAPDITITFMRHGDSCYSQKELETCAFEGKLTETGRKQTKKSAELIAADMKEKEEQNALIWCSTRSRADETAQILTNILERNGIVVLSIGEEESKKKHRSFCSLSAPDVTPEFWAQKPKNEFFVRIWKELDEAGKLPEGTESPAQSEKKLNRVLEYNRRVVKILKKSPYSKKTRLINVSHFETPTTILQKAYGGKSGIDKEFGPEDAGILNLEMQLTKEGGLIKVDYKRGYQEGKQKEREVYLKLDKNRNLSKIETS